MIFACKKVQVLLLASLLGAVNFVYAQTDEQLPAEKTRKEQRAAKNRENWQKFKEKVSLNGWVDFQYAYNYQDLNDGKNDQSNVFQIRRARLDVKGNLTPKISFRLQGDLANTPKLIDAFAKVNFCKYIAVQAGQFKIPFSIENAYSPLNLEFADNAQVVSALSGYSDVTGISSYANGREMGVMLSGTLAEYTRNEEKIPILEYSIGVFGGNGINVKKDNMAKDVSGRLDFHPFLKDLVLSASAYLGTYTMQNADGRYGKRNRFAVGAEYKNKNLTIRSEYIWGTTGFYDTTLASLYYLETRGIYLTAGYWFHFGWGKNSSVQQKLRPVLRVDFYQKDIDAKRNSLYYSAGVDWWPEKHLRLQVNYVLKQQQQYKALGHSLVTMLSVKF